MTAAVETMMYIGKTPWHNLGQEIPENDGYSVVTSMKAAGLDWTADKFPVYTHIPGISKEIPVPDCFAVVRSSDKKVLGHVGARYHILQNAEAFEWFSPFLESKAARFETAGSLKEGSRIWVLAKLNLDPGEVVKGDAVDKYVLLAHAHDGSLKVRVGFTPIRVVCQNTLTMAIADKASKLFSIKHSRNMKDNLDSIRECMNLANQQFEATMEQYRQLARKKFSVAELDRYLKIVLLGSAKAAEETKEFSTRTLNTLENLRKLVITSPGNEANNVALTMWAAYNGVTNWLQYEKGRTEESRLNSIWFGTDHEVNKLALQTALDMAV